MNNNFKYIGIISILLFSFIYTNYLSNKIMYKNDLVKEISDKSSNYNVLPVSAIIENNYITPGLNGESVNIIKSFNNMKDTHTFNSNYLKYDKVIPDISINNNKSKIIKYGNSYKNSVVILVSNNIEFINYANEKDIKITRLITYDTFDKNVKYEQINNDFENYDDVEKMLNNNNLNKNICIYNKEEQCLNNNKYLVEPSIIINTYNYYEYKDKVKSGYIIYIKDEVSLSNIKLLIKELNYKGIKVIYLSKLISEERD